MSYKHTDIAQAIATRPPMPEQILPGLLRKTVGALVAPGATGKSIFGLEIAAYIATGHDFFGLGDRECGRALVFSAEDPGEILRLRVHDIAQAIAEDKRAALIGNLDVIEVAARDPRDLLDGGKTTEAMCEAAAGFDLVLVDTISRFHTGEESTRGDAARVMRELECVAETTGAAVVFLGHTSKFAAMNGQIDAQQAARGSSVWVDEARWVGFLSTCTKEEAATLGLSEDMRKRYVRHGLSKTNYIEPRLDVWLRRGDGGVLTPYDMPALRAGATRSQNANAQAYIEAKGGRVHGFF